MVDDSDRTVVSGAPAADATVVLGDEGGSLAFEAADRTQMAVSADCPVCHTTNPPGETYCGDCGFILATVPEAVVEDAGSPQARLIAADGREFALGPGRNTVGRINADVLLPDPSVSRMHAAVTIQDGRCRVEDLASTNGTTVNARRLAPNEPHDLADGDEVAFGAVSLRAALPEGMVQGIGVGEPAPEVAPKAAAVESLARLISEESGVEYPIPVGTTSIGRRSANALAFPTDPYMSGRHAEVSFDGEMLTLVDVGSTNGSFLNDDRLAPSDPRTLADGDLLVLGQQRLRVCLEPIIEEPQPQEPEPAEDQT